MDLKRLKNNDQTLLILFIFIFFSMGACITHNLENEKKIPKIELGTLTTNDSLLSNQYPSAQLNAIMKEADYYFEINLIWLDASVFKPHHIPYQRRMQVTFKSVTCLRSPRGFEHYLSQHEGEGFFVLVSGSIA
jgi:hypothetical protein